MQEAQWYYARNGKSEGPVDLAGLQRLQQDGVITGHTLLWCEGMAGWQALQTLQSTATPASGAEAVATASSHDPYRAPVAAATPDVIPLGAGLTGQLGLYAAIVGGNFPIYRKRWRLDQGTANAAGTWHWPGFLFGVIWMMYRKMYRMAAIWVGVLVASSAIEAFIEVPDALSLVINLGLSVTVGVFANSWYLQHCQREIARVQSLDTGNDAAVRSALAARGDTSVIGAVIAIAVSVTLAIVGAMSIG
ncbi:DUF2628 domain-containing protein [Stenotrophomonas lactitubi]|uniref:DUF2628 domain-containing protein n=1 Tax=Stenotrophomonas lactitubi TaxID=2045214 RepID=UPI001DFF0FDE|nr:DUF2628 domain-containing protein [Stenotrophomonas lactitubi]CAH0164214.1 hypothetical protein SRABI66_01037 [Stenotrophomonas lactitubi]CAH0281731.1 hypothetical protein SRABI122_03950 [Stenotrophomonas lactitubi]CAH0283445.1 hypothetical protein SRABI81_04053 [Stenotrophomonas lactitubi]CAH0283746.1 hypothetical protein SRABI102_03912 [Stenotrophomonas lactitubi]